MTSIQLGKTTNLLFSQFDLATLIKKGVWLFVVIVSIIYSVVGSQNDLFEVQAGFEAWVYVYFNFLSFVLGVLAGMIIFFRRPNSWMAFMTSLMLVTFTATESGLRFWYQWFTGLPFSMAVMYKIVQPVPFFVSLFIDVFYRALLTTSLAYVLLAFPEGKILSRRSRWFFGLLVASQVLLILVIGAICLLDILVPQGDYLSPSLYDFLDKVKAILLIILAAWPILRLRRITDPVQRQQIRWITSSLTGMTILYAIYTIYALTIDKPLVSVWLFLIGLVFTYGFILTLFIALMRYRLWDMNFMINKAIMYSLMTAVLGIFGLLGAALLEILTMKSDSSLMTVAGLVVVSAVFHPVKDRMQAFVDRHLKPEEVDFSRSIVEIAPEAQLVLSSGDILKILIRQTVEQLNLSGAIIYLRWPDGQLVQSEPAALNPLAPHLKLDDKTRDQLEKGNVVVPPEGSPVSLYVPLVINRAARPDFLGVLVLEPRNNGEGYPTVLLNSLRKLGGDAGKAIYLAQLRERVGQNMIDRLTAVERGLLIRQKPLDA